MEGEDTFSYITNTVIEMKRRFLNPQLVMAGDFNQWKVEEALDDFADMPEADVGLTRKDKCLDYIFVNMSRSITGSGMLAGSLSH